MIGDYVAALWVQRKLSCPWRVVVALTDPEGVEPAYSLEPDPRGEQSISLDQLQADIAVLAAGLASDIRDRTRKLLVQVDEYLLSDRP